jgi:hypothetical protein
MPFLEPWIPPFQAMSFFRPRCVSIPLMRVMVVQRPQMDIGMFGTSDGDVQRTHCAQRRTQPNDLHSIQWLRLTAWLCS